MDNANNTGAENMTTAENIANSFDNDGQCWEVDGVTFTDACEAANPSRTVEFDKIRYEFPDDSVLTVCGDGWDHGFLGCMCWRDADHGRHGDECEVVSNG